MCSGVMWKGGMCRGIVGKVGCVRRDTCRGVMWKGGCGREGGLFLHQDLQW